ncbi:MAG: hypothetical protein Q4Q42_06945, partial [Planctomycetia bacterium]|nr:hypothetical protein [Planctomycetia bacterium]
ENAAVEAAAEEHKPAALAAAAGAEPSAPAPAPEAKPAAPAPAPAATTPAKPTPAEIAAKADAEKALLANAQTFQNGGAYMAVIPIRKVNPSTANVMLSSTIPGLDVITEYSTRSLIVYGSKSGVEAAIKLASQLDGALDATLEVITLSQPLPADVISALPRIEPTVVSTYDKSNNRLLLTGRKVDVERLKSYVMQIEEKTSEEPESVYYLDVERDVPGEIQDYIKRAVPGVELTYSSENRRFTIIGTPTEQLAAAKLVNDAIVNLPPENETRYYKFDEQVSDTMIELLNERVKNVSKIERDTRNNAVLRVTAKPYQHEEIAQAIEKIQAEYPLKDENSFATYLVTSDVVTRFNQVKDDFQKDHGSIKLLDDGSKGVLSVWALPAQQAALKKLLEELGNLDSVSKTTAALYKPKHVDAPTLISILTDLHPSVKATNDTVNARLILRGTADALAAAQETLAALDVVQDDAVVRVYKAYPVQGFYSTDKVGNYYSPQYYLRDISALVPAARVSFDYYNQQIIVWGTEEEHAIVAKVIDDLTKNTGVDKRIMRWQIRRANYSTLTTQIAAVYPRAVATYDAASKTLLIRAANGVSLDAVTELLELLDPEEVSEFDPVLEYYDAGAKPSPDLISAVESLVPNASLVSIDEKTQQLLVIAKPAEHKIVADNIERLAKTYGSTDLRMIPYPVYSMKVASLVDDMTEAYPAASFAADDRGSRLLVRATLQDHVRISEEIARLNEEYSSETGETVAPGPRVIVYEVDTPQIAAQIRGVVNSLIPDAESFGGMNAYGPSTGQKEKLAILANGHDHERIKAIVDSFNQTSEEDKLEFAIYPYGEASLEMIDSILCNLLPSAIAIDQPEMGETVAARQARRMQYMRQRSMQSGRYNAEPKPSPFYRIDGASKTVALFATQEEHETVRGAIEKIASTSGDEAKIITRVLRLGSPVSYQVASGLRLTYPTCTSFATNGNELIVTGPESEVAKCEELVGELNKEQYERIGNFLTLKVPAESNYNRDTLITILRGHFTSLGISPYPGLSPDQITIWGREDSLEFVSKWFNELVATPNEASYVTYPLTNTRLDLAVAFLSKVCPNASITPDPTRNCLVVYATPEMQTAVADALKEFDKPVVEGAEIVGATYDWKDQATFWAIFAELRQRFPEATIMPLGSQYYVTAPKQVQDKLGDYISRRITSVVDNAFAFEPYYLKNINLTRLVQISQYVLPGVWIFAGKGTNEIFAVATPQNHAKLKKLIAAMEALPPDSEAQGITPKIYKISTLGANLVIPTLQPQLPGVVMYPLPNNRIIVWGSEAEHAHAEKVLETFAEAFPESVLAKYPVVNLNVTDILSFCQSRFVGQAVFWPASTGELMCQAPADIQTEVESLIQRLDVRNPDMEFVPVAYDLSDIPATSHPLLVGNIQRVDPTAIILPSSTPGFIVLYARPATQKRLGEVVEELLKERDSAQQKMVAYTVKRLTYPQLSGLLLPLYPNVKIGVGTNANQVIILAKPAEHEKIAELIEQINADHDDGMSSRVYRLKNSQLAVAREAIMTMYPQAVVVIDQLSRSVLVKAYTDEHEKIAQLVKEIDEKDPERNTSFKVFNIGTISFTRLLPALRNFYANDPAFQIQLDSAQQCLIVRGTSIQHKAVEDLINELKTGGMADSESYMQTYTLKNQSSLSSLYNVFYEQGRDINMYRDYSTGKLVVIGRPEEHKMVQDVLDMIAPEETELAVFELVYVDPQAARQVFSMLENDGTYVDVRFDSNSNQLYVRATPTKLEEIRRLLVKMGEKDLQKMKPFVETTAKGAVSTDNKRIYMNDNLYPKEKVTSTTIDVTRLEPVTAETIDKLSSAKAELDVKGVSESMRSVEIKGADPEKVLDAVLKSWNRENPIHVVEPAPAS